MSVPWCRNQVDTRQLQTSICPEHRCEILNKFPVSEMQLFCRKDNTL